MNFLCVVWWLMVSCFVVAGCREKNLTAMFDSYDLTDTIGGPYVVT
jgi:hypothetical protein